MGTLTENGIEKVYGYIDLFKTMGDSAPTQMYPLTVKNIKIGREHSCEIRIHNLRVSRLQCSLSMQEGIDFPRKVLLQNLTSKPTTIYKNQGISPNATVELEDGDRFRLYDTELRWRAYNPDNKDGQPDPNHHTTVVRLSLTKDSPSRVMSSKRKSDRPDKSPSGSTTSTRSKSTGSSSNSSNSNSPTEKGAQSAKRRRNSDIDMRKAVLKKSFRRSVQGKSFPAFNELQEGGDDDNDGGDEFQEEFDDEEDEGDVTTASAPAVDSPQHNKSSSSMTANNSQQQQNSLITSDVLVNPIEDDLILLSPLIPPPVESSNDLIQFDSSYEAIEREMFALHHGETGGESVQEGEQTSIPLAVKISLSSETDSFVQPDSSSAAATTTTNTIATTSAELNNSLASTQPLPPITDLHHETVDGPTQEGEQINISLSAETDSFVKPDSSSAAATPTTTTSAAADLNNSLVHTQLIPQISDVNHHESVGESVQEGEQTSVPVAVKIPRSSETDSFVQPDSSSAAAEPNISLENTQLMPQTNLSQEEQQLQEEEETELIDIADDNGSEEGGVDDDNIEVIDVSPYSQDQRTPSNEVAIESSDDMASPEVVDVSDSPFVPANETANDEEDDILVAETPVGDDGTNGHDVVVVVPDTSAANVEVGFDDDDAIVVDTTAHDVSTRSSVSMNQCRLSVDSVQEVVSDLHSVVLPQSDTSNVEKNNEENVMAPVMQDKSVPSLDVRDVENQNDPDNIPTPPISILFCHSPSSISFTTPAETPNVLLEDDDDEVGEQEIEHSAGEGYGGGEDEDILPDVSENKENVVAPAKHSFSILKENKQHATQHTTDDDQEEDEDDDHAVQIEDQHIQIDNDKSTTKTKACFVVLNQINVDHGSSSSSEEEEEEEEGVDQAEEQVMAEQLSVATDIEVLSDRTNDPKTPLLNDSLTKPFNKSIAKSTEPPESPAVSSIKLRNLSIVVQRLSMNGDTIVMTPEESSLSDNESEQHILSPPKRGRPPVVSITKKGKKTTAKASTRKKTAGKSLKNPEDSEKGDDDDVPVPPRTTTEKNPPKKSPILPRTTRRSSRKRAAETKKQSSSAKKAVERIPEVAVEAEESSDAESVQNDPSPPKRGRPTKKGKKTNVKVSTSKKTAAKSLKNPEDSEKDDDDDVPVLPTTTTEKNPPKKSPILPRTTRRSSRKRAAETKKQPSSAKKTVERIPEVVVVEAEESSDAESVQNDPSPPKRGRPAAVSTKKGKKTTVRERKKTVGKSLKNPEDSEKDDDDVPVPPTTTTEKNSPKKSPILPRTTRGSSRKRAAETKKQPSSAKKTVERIPEVVVEAEESSDAESVQNDPSPPKRGRPAAVSTKKGKKTTVRERKKTVGKSLKNPEDSEKDDDVTILPTTIMEKNPPKQSSILTSTTGRSSRTRTTEASRRLASSSSAKKVNPKLMRRKVIDEETILLSSDSESIASLPNRRPSTEPKVAATKSRTTATSSRSTRSKRK